MLTCFVSGFCISCHGCIYDGFFQWCWWTGFSINKFRDEMKRYHLSYIESTIVHLLKRGYHQRNNIHLQRRGFMKSWILLFFLIATPPASIVPLLLHRDLLVQNQDGFWFQHLLGTLWCLVWYYLYGNVIIIWINPVCVNFWQVQQFLFPCPVVEYLPRLALPPLSRLRWPIAPFSK